MNKLIIVGIMMLSLNGCSLLFAKNIFQHNLLYEDGMKFRVDDQLAACLRIHTPSKKRHKLRCFIVPEDAIALWLNRAMPHLNLHKANIMVAPRQR